MGEIYDEDAEYQFRDVDVPVLIVGAGPAGATTALLLARYGIPAIVISRHKGTANTPRAHIFNQRAMEVLRDAGIQELVTPLAASKEDIMHVSWVQSLTGEEYGRVYAWGNRPDRIGEYTVASPCQMSDLPQSILEPILVQEATTTGADLRFYHEFVSQEALPDGRVQTTVLDRQTGLNYRVTSRFLIGADGARSAVLDSVGIPIDGKQLATAFNVHIKADLAKYCKHRPGSLCWILNPEAPDWSATACVRMVRPWHEFIVSMHPSALLQTDIEHSAPTRDQVLSRLRQLFGDDSIRIELLGYDQWHINDQVARTWQKGNVLCIGDAVHRHPPINGLGSNTCISDAFNIAWKLAFVLKGFADVSILKTLTTERKPVGDGIVRRANEGMLVHHQLWTLMGSTSEARDAIDWRLRQKTKEGAELRQTLRSLMEKTDDEFNALGIQMNQSYLHSALTIREDSDTAPPCLDNVNLLKQQVISTFPGYHLPHVWLVRDGQSERISTLDLVGKGHFTLLTGIGGEAWKTACAAISENGLLPLKSYSIGVGQDYMDAYWDWQNVRGVDEDGAVLWTLGAKPGSGISRPPCIKAALYKANPNLFSLSTRAAPDLICHSSHTLGTRV
ncbi:2,4-dichlorophenol 6-monooxygenase [Cyphellophora attinorum]|uniref:2,4-dichlorophenol 6-monooxygenase n=1 Tax=Cyphellophora attinorum TaxID=1664694 RepID=A0A0N1H9U9_9EURO|nr:2,4-dichlorophenol 6-monooxygenase [Phialophora attinorum]KPI44455.1 2,4-dichlorophenol 6-monooxygenase [Phialophora attinorum]